MNTFVLGGARSGKSRFAERLAEKLAESQKLPVTYLATSETVDAEFAERVHLHQHRRPIFWETAEVPLNVAPWLENLTESRIVLLDCISMLVNNWMYHEGTEAARFADRLDGFVSALKATCATVIAVSSEVGQSIVPTDRNTRLYRDWLGTANQAVAEISDEVYLVTAGIPINLRQWEASW